MTCLPKILEKSLGTDILSIFEEFKKGPDDNPNQVKLEQNIPEEMKKQLQLKDFLNSVLEMKEASIEGLTSKDQIANIGKKMKEIDEKVEFEESQQFKVDHTFVDFFHMNL